MKNTNVIFKIVFTGILIALMVALSWTPLGMVPLGFGSATTIFIPVAIGIIILDDYRCTLILGFSFGLISLLRAITAASGPLDVFFVDVRISIVPRVIAAFVTHLCFRMLKKIIKQKTIVATITGGLTALFNTFFTMGILLIMHFQELLTAVDQTFFVFIGGLALLYMLPEIILGSIIALVIYRTYKSINNRMENDDLEASSN